MAKTTAKTTAPAEPKSRNPRKRGWTKPTNLMLQDDNMADVQVIKDHLAEESYAKGGPRAASMSDAARYALRQVADKLREKAAKAK